jgi:hypothetical protein
LRALGGGERGGFRGGAERDQSGRTRVEDSVRVSFQCDGLNGPVGGERCDQGDEEAV